MLNLQQQILQIRRDRTLTPLGRMAKIHNLTKTQKSSKS